MLFALRLWASVCLALYVAFALQLERPLLGRHDRGAGLPAATRRVAAQGLVPPDRDGRGRRRDRGDRGLVPAGPRRLPDGPRLVERGLRVRRRALEELRRLWRGPRRLHRRGDRRRRVQPGRRGVRPAGGRPGHHAHDRDRAGHRVRRRRPGADRPRRRPAAARRRIRLDRRGRRLGPGGGRLRAPNRSSLRCARRGAR